MEQLIISHILHGKFQENTSEHERGTMERMTSPTFEIVVDFKKNFSLVVLSNISPRNPNPGRGSAHARLT
jgi:hypothetical protein